MKDLGKILLSKDPFNEIVIGNTAIVRAFIESGTRVVTSYPGSPTPEIASAISSMPKDDRPFYFEFSVNEKVATEVAYGASVNGHLSTVFFKSVGLNVAADTFVQMSLMELIGGMVIILGDDPGAHSSQNEQDNRHYAQLSYTPVFEPSTPQEVYSMYLEAAKISQQKKMPVILRLTTHTCHQKEKVEFGSWSDSKWDKTPKFSTENGNYIPIAKSTHPMKEKALNKLNEVKTLSENFASTVNNSNSDRGVITMGVPFLSLMDIVEDSPKKPDVLKLGMIYPLPEKKILDFLKSHKEVKILEELDDVLEKDIKTLAYDNGLKTKIIGKSKISDFIGEYNPDKTYEIMSAVWSDAFPPKKTKDYNSPTPSLRPPQMCPGCGHRSAFYAIKKALANEDITVADIGCHTLGFLPPYKMGELLLCMGASSGIASGLSIGQDSRKVVAFLGDSTFFHAGIPGIINSMFNKHNFTLVVMENGTTAMTGHQNHPAVGKNFDEISDKIPIRRVLEGLGVKHISEVDAYSQKKLTELVKESLDINEFSIIIAKHPCMLKYHREQRRKEGFVPRRVTVDKDVCNNVDECISTFACPTFTRKEDGSIEANRDLCIGDGSCIQTCPTKAIKPQKPEKK